jgi:hypothetical protein
MSYAYSVAAQRAANVAGNTALVALLDATGAASIRIRASGGTLLAEIPLATPSGSVDPDTAQVTFTIAGIETSAPAGGLASTAEMCDGAGTAHLTMPCAEGTVAVSGYCVLTTLVIAAGAPVGVDSVTIG